MNIIYIALGIIVFFSAAITAIIYYLFYRKYNNQLTDAFRLLQRHSLLQLDDYFLYEKMGVPGFGFRASLISKILKGKRFQIAKHRWVESEANELIRQNYDWGWVKKFNTLGYVIVFLFVVMMLLAVLGDFI